MIKYFSEWTHSTIWCYFFAILWIEKVLHHYLIMHAEIKLPYWTFDKIILYRYQVRNKSCNNQPNHKAPYYIPCVGPCGAIDEIEKIQFLQFHPTSYKGRHEIINFAVCGWFTQCINQTQHSTLIDLLFIYSVFVIIIKKKLIMKFLGVNVSSPGPVSSAFFYVRQTTKLTS